MKLKFSSDQDYQLEAIRSTIDVFEGQPLNKGNYEISFGMEGASLAFTEKGIANKLVLSPLQLIQNIQQVQKQNIGAGIENYKPDTEIFPMEYETAEGTKETANFPNLTIEMETGTGKTYTYLRTIYEMNKVYGFKKFVIVVPSVAIREGTIKNLEITHEHFQSLYENPPMDFTLYDSKKLSALRNFATANSIQVLVINIDSFTKDANIINQVRETGVKPIEYLQGTNPIVIVDEPQNMETDIRKRAIANLNPLCTLRYSATHRNFYNLIYKLDPVQAYDKGLVKQIEVDGIVTEDNLSSAYISFEDIKQAKTSVKAKLRIYINDKNGVKPKLFTVGTGADLYELSNQREIYKDRFIINSINAEWGEIEFANGLILTKGQDQGGLTEEVMKFQIERTIKKHFEKERRYKQFGIKVLSLFFIDKVANYRAYNEAGEPSLGKFAIWFEELFEKYKPKDYPFTASQVHNGYFSMDKKGKLKDSKENRSTKDDNDTYSLIMKDKEKLLTEGEPLRFIFSHSALREGWDNPNVFQICTLNETKSDLKKRQEIGRGLRLPVNAEGQRIFDKKVNILTVVANETYQDFSEQLQKEIEEETSVSFAGRIKDARKKAQVKLSKELTPASCPEFFEIWDKIKYKTNYRVSYTSEDLISKSIENMKEMPLTAKPILTAQTGRLDITGTGIEASQVAMEMQEVYGAKYTIPDIFAYIQNKINITRTTIYEILQGSQRLEELEDNPQMFLDNAVGCIQRALNQLMVDGIKYERIKGGAYEMHLFENEEIETFLSNLFKVGKPEKTLYNYVHIDSKPESEFARDCETDENVKFYFKLPKAFKIRTPIGSYNPDWAVIFDNDKRIYFVAETKSSIVAEERRAGENMKIKCGKAHFALFKEEGVQYHVLDSVKGLYRVPS